MAATNNSGPAFSLYRRVSIRLFGYDYFISYSHGDADPYVHDLQRRLSRTHLGFVDSSGDGLFVGSPLAREITRALRRSKVLIVVYTDAVASKRWTKLECRYFKACHPNRPFIPVSALKDAKALQAQLQVLFDHDQDKLSKELKDLLASTANPPTSADLDPCWAIEPERTTLADSLPSERVIKQIQNAFYGLSVPRKAAIAVSTLVVITCLAIGLGWSQFANSRANAVLVELAGRMGKEQIREVETRTNLGFYLMAEFHESALSSSARARGVALQAEFDDVLQKLRAYDFYRRWNISSRGYAGAAIGLYSIPDLVPAPMGLFPANPKEIRLICTELNDNWLHELQQLDSCDLLAITCDEIASEGMLLDTLNSLCVHDLRLRNCRRVDLNTLSQLSDSACTSLEALSLSRLDDWVVESDQEELRLAQFLKRCENLRVLKLRELSRCKLSAVFANAIAAHPALSQTGGELHLERSMLSDDFQIYGNGKLQISGAIQELDTMD